jgi:hypothetical protein
MVKIKLNDFGAGDILCCPTCNDGYLHVLAVEHSNDNVSIAYECESCNEPNVLEIHNFKGNKTISWFDGK